MCELQVGAARQRSLVELSTAPHHTEPSLLHWIDSDLYQLTLTVPATPDI